MPASRARVGVIFFTVLIDLIGFGIVLPILPFYAQRFGAAGLGYGGVIGVFSLMQFVATALLGKLSDRIGRRPVLLTTMLVNAVGYALFAFAGSYWVLFLSRVVSGFAGGNISAAQAYMADITTPAERSKGMAVVGAAFGIGFSLGPAIGGFAHQWGGDAAPGLVAVGLSLANFVSAYFILPESLKSELRVKRPLFDLGHIGEAIARPRLRPLMAVWAFVPLAFAGYTVALPLWASAALGWQERELAILFTIIGVTAASVQGYFFGKIVRRTGERTLVIAGTFGMALAIAIVPFLPSSALLYGWTFVLAVSNSVFARGDRTCLRLCRSQRARHRARRRAGDCRAGPDGGAAADRHSVRHCEPSHLFSPRGRDHGDRGVRRHGTRARSASRLGSRARGPGPFGPVT